MKKNLTWMLMAVVLIALIGGASMLYNQLGEEYKMEQLATEVPAVTAPNEETQTTTEPKDTMAPDFTVVDAEGNAVKLSDYFGKPIVLNFWASWCGPCRSEMPDFDEAYQSLGEEITFLMVNMTDGSQETLESALTFVTESGYTFPVFFDTGFEAAITYGVTTLPRTYFIAADGTLVAYAASAIDAETLQRGIDMITE